MRGVVYKVSKLLFVPLNYTSNLTAEPEDQTYIDMI
jgi:hypothetical protein